MSQEMRDRRLNLLELAAAIVMTTWILGIGLGLYGFGVSGLLQTLAPPNRDVGEVAAVWSMLLGPPFVSGMLFYWAARRRHWL